MERTLYLIIGSLCFINFSFAQNEYKEDIYNCFVNNKMSEWKKIIDNIEGTQNKSNALRLELLNYQYGYIAWCLGNDKEDEAERYLNLAVNNADILMKKGYNVPIIHAYKSALWGYKIGLASYKAPFLGPESIEFAEKSVTLDSKNYLGYIQLGNIKYYMPSIFGGSKLLALNYYLKALKLMENNQPTKDWNYLSLLITIAQAYTGIENYEKAKIYYQKVLKIEPNFDWVKNELLPKLNNKIRKNE